MPRGVRFAACPPRTLGSFELSGPIEGGGWAVAGVDERERRTGNFTELCTAAVCTSASLRGAASLLKIATAALTLSLSGIVYGTYYWT